MKPRATYGNPYWRILVHDVDFVVACEREQNSCLDDKLYRKGNYFIHKEDALTMCDALNKVFRDEAIITPLEEENE